MIRKGITVREATEMWVERFNAVPTDMIGRLMWLDNHDNWTEVTKPSLGDEVLVFDSALPAKYSGDEWEGTVIGYDEESGHYRIKLCDGFEVSLVEGTFEVAYNSCLPMWSTMWSFKDRDDNRWLEERGNIALMSSQGFRIYKSRDFGYFFGIDGAGGDFYEAFWLPLYRARGMQWHDPATEAKGAA